MAKKTKTANTGTINSAGALVLPVAELKYEGNTSSLIPKNRFKEIHSETYLDENGILFGDMEAREKFVVEHFDIELIDMRDAYIPEDEQAPEEFTEAEWRAMAIAAIRTERQFDTVMKNVIKNSKIQRNLAKLDKNTNEDKFLVIFHSANNARGKRHQKLMETKTKNQKK